MKREELKFKNDITFINGTSWLQACLWNRSFYARVLSDGQKYIYALDDALEAAQTTEQFVGLMLSDNRFKSYQGWKELLKRERPDAVPEYVQSEIWEQGGFSVMSDAGGVKVGNDNFSTIFDNGYGDGETLVSVYDKQSEFDLDGLLEFNTSIECHDAYIYDYDCGGEPVSKLYGRYGVYSGYGCVAFVRWN